MKKIFYSVFFCICFIQIASAQRVIVKGRNTVRTKTIIAPVYFMEDLVGKWQEIKRTSLSGSRFKFGDSLQLNFNKRDSVIVRDGITMSQQGGASVMQDKLSLAGDMYDILSLNNDKLVINDGTYIRVLQRKKSFYYESLGKIIISRDNLSIPVIPETKKLQGKWYVYRTQATPGAAADSAIIKNIVFNKNKTSLSGQVTFNKDGLPQAQPFSATINKSQLLISTTMHIWDVQIFKADGKELVFGNEGGLVYFAKQFR
ncbi:MAG: hypothetical protein ABIO05_07390 [Ferruginibacter sp.]